MPITCSHYHHQFILHNNSVYIRTQHKHQHKALENLSQNLNKTMVSANIITIIFAFTAAYISYMCVLCSETSKIFVLFVNRHLSPWRFTSIHLFMSHFRFNSSGSESFRKILKDRPYKLTLSTQYIIHSTLFPEFFLFTQQSKRLILNATHPARSQSLQF